MYDTIKKDRILLNLLQDIKKKPLALFVGAGINVPVIPTWDGLLDDIMDTCIRMNLLPDDKDKGAYQNLINWHKSSALSVYEKASFIKIMSEKQYLYLLEDVLYKRITTLKPSSTLQSIARICSSEKVRAVVSYNYDDFLLSEVRKTRNAYNSSEVNTPDHTATYISNEFTNAIDKPDLPFYYVHGFIPRKNNYINNQNSEIVLSYDEYFLNMLNPYSWQTVSQIYFLKNYTCLFLGTSLSDWAMLRLIQYANDGNNSIYLMMSEPSIYNKKDPFVSSDYVRKNIIRTKATILSSFGVKLILTGETFDSVSKAVDYIYKTIDNN